MIGLGLGTPLLFLCKCSFQRPLELRCCKWRNAELLRPRSLRWSFSLRLGHGSGGLVFDHDGGAYQSVWWPSWCLSSGSATESGLAPVAETGCGNGSLECGARPGALECERCLRCRLEGGATKSAGSLAEGA